MIRLAHWIIDWIDARVDASVQSEIWKKYDAVREENESLQDQLAAALRKIAELDAELEARNDNGR